MLHRMKRFTAEVGEVLDDTRRMKNAKPPPSVSDKFVDRSIEHLLGSMRKIIPDRQKFLAQLERVSRKVDNAEIRHRQANVLNTVCGVVAIVGFFMAAGGFWLWYSRVQVYLDKRLKAEASGHL
jgi:hypothetical protein